MTLIFNIFVFYTLFNQINCRVIDDSLNIFIRMNRSLLFPLICLLEMVLQVVIIFIGKSPFHVVNEGFTGEQWGICIGFSAITFVVSIIVKFIPIHILIDKILESKNKNEANEENDNNSDNNGDTKQIKFENDDTKNLKIKKSNKSLKLDNNDSLVLSEHNGGNTSRIM